MSSSSAFSSPTSFHTAHDEPSTAASSPAHVSSRPYRDAHALPRELKEHCHIFLEEQLYTSAIGLLSSVLASGASKRRGKGRLASIPPPSHLALLSTLAVHPLHTTRVEKQEHLEVSSLALDYLRNLLLGVGPVNANLSEAFRFNSICRSTRRGGQSTRDNGSDGSDAEPERDDDDRVRGRLAGESSLWGRGQSFWATLGWAFKCSTLHPQRWRHWRLWLEYMVNVLDSDWEERKQRDEEASGSGREAPCTWREESIIRIYMDQQHGTTYGIRGIMKALLAFKSDDNFSPVFDDELKGPVCRSNKRKRSQVLDLENDKFGDYYDDESVSSGASEPPTPQTPKASPSDSSMYSAGLVESITIRLGLFRLLSKVYFELGEQAELHRLYEEFAVALRNLPLPVFALFFTQRPDELIEQSYTTLAKELFHQSLPSNHAKPAKVDPDVHACGGLSTLMLEKCYIPYAANNVSVEDNAKLSVLIEHTIQLLWRIKKLHYSQELEDAAIEGIKKRELKVLVKRGRKSKTGAGEALGSEALKESGKRIRILFEALKLTS